MIDLEPKYLPYAIPQDGVTNETIMRWAPMFYFSRKVLPEIQELDDSGTWNFAYHWANDVDRVGDFMVLMDICDSMVWTGTMHVPRADVFVRRLADGVLRRPNYLSFVERHIPGCLGAAERSWRQVGAWVLHALYGGDTGSASPSALVPGLEYPAPGRELEREIMRLYKVVRDKQEFVVYLELLATAFSQSGNFIENRSIINYVSGLATAVSAAYPHEIQPNESYTILTWPHLAKWLGMATVMD